ncbi:MAG: FHA domain-containing protein [Planctomycetota bacterium]|jgi:pSer/pThr/pTyr-binding forkhead associated (FHA) protein
MEKASSAMLEDNENQSVDSRDLPPVVEEFVSVQKIVKWVSEPDSFGRGGSGAKYAPEDNQDFRPSMRPPVPVLTLLDDGSMEQGEEIRLRRERVAIGRTSGDVQLPNDPAISATHAELRRTQWNGGFQWHLHDMGSSNGTFVRCARAVLHENATLILGARRFRLRNPLKPNTVAPVGYDTNPIDGRYLPEAVWPVLIEAIAKPSAVEFSLRSDRLIIGRAGGGGDIQLDDPLLANRHAELKRMRDGSWLISAETTRNGIWVSISTVALTSSCFFRCGEQRFRFVMS